MRPAILILAVDVALKIIQIAPVLLPCHYWMPVRS